MDNDAPISGKHRSWVFTLNNWKDEEWISITVSWEVKYLCVGQEGVDPGKTPHLQGFVTWPSPRSFRATKRMADRAHWKVAKGDSLDSQVYCSKEGGVFFEKGDIPKPGKRNDLKGVLDSLSAGDGVGSIVRGGANGATIRYAEQICKYVEPGRSWIPQVIWLWGATGVGKTELAYKYFPDLWVSGTNSKWWDGYDAHETVLLDDFRREDYAWSVLLKILDSKPLRVEVKNGFRSLLAKNIIITAPVGPEAMFVGFGEDVGQLLRRISFVWEVKNDN